MRICDWSSDVCSSDLIFHTNGWQGQRQTRNHWQGDLPADEARAAFVHARGALETAGWDFRPEHTKVLMLTQRALANELGYGSLPGIFRYNDAFADKSDPHIAWFVEMLEPAALAFEARRYGAMLAALGRSEVRRDGKGCVRTCRSQC